MLCSVVDAYWHFEGTYHPHFPYWSTRRTAIYDKMTNHYAPAHHKQFIQYPNQQILYSELWAEPIIIHPTVNFRSAIHFFSLVFYMPHNLEEDIDFCSEHCIIKKSRPNWMKKIVRPRTADRETDLRRGSCHKNITPVDWVSTPQHHSFICDVLITAL